MEVGRLEHRADAARPALRAPRRADRRSARGRCVGAASPSSIRSVVVFPAPFGPRKPVIVPASSANESSSTASTLPNRFVNESATTANSRAPAPDELNPDKAPPPVGTTRSYPTTARSCMGQCSGTPRQPLVVMLRGDVDAGTQFFARLEELERHPNRDREMLELQYHCMALGFRGKYRVPGRSGDRSLNAVASRPRGFLRDTDAEGAPLSPNWKGVVASDEPQRFIVPIWVMAVGRGGRRDRLSISGSRWA